MSPKPHLYRHNGWWHCGIRLEPFIFWSCALSPSEAYRLWKRSRP